MMRVFWDEWRGAQAFTARTGFPFLVIACAGALGLSGLQPGAWFEVLGCALVIGGLRSGNQRWNQVSPRDWVLVHGVGPGAYLAGKVAGLVFTAGLWALLLSPGLVLTALVWGIPAAFIPVCLAWALAGGLVAQGLGHLVTWGPSDLFRLAGGTLVGAWLVVTFLVADLSPWNPLWQIGRLQGDPGADPGFASLGLLTAAAGGLWAPVLVVQGRWRAGR